MKLNRYFKWMLGASLLLSGCADDDFIDRSQIWDGNIPDNLTLTLTIPDPEIVALGNTRGADGPIERVTLMQYDTDGKWLGNIAFEDADITSDGDTWQLTATLDKSTRSLQVVANYDVTDSDENPASLTTDADYLNPYTGKATKGGYNGPVLWADVELGELLSGNEYTPTIALQRQAAKLTVEVEDDADFSLTGFMVYGMAEEGCVAPLAANVKSGAPTIPASVSGTYKSEMMADTDGTLYFFETAAEDADKNPTARVIVKGTYEGKEYYYVAAFRTREATLEEGASETPGYYKYTGIPVLRNHWYTLTVEKVRATGWNTLEEAYTAMPDNRATIVLHDQTANVTDMIATRDYMLGVSGEVEAEWNGTADFTVVTKYAANIDAAAQNKLPVHLTTNDDWILISEQDAELVIGNSTHDYQITLAPNSISTDERVGEITVTLGKLTRTVKVVQKGRPLRRERTAEIYGLTGLTDGTHYYEWIDGKGTEPAPQGLEDVENRGENRKDALIFAAVPAYTIYYKIPVSEGDKSCTITGGDTSAFTATKDGSYYVVEATTTDKPNIAKAEMEIVNVDDAVIKYDLLQTGYFHKLDGQYQATAPGVRTGWFYYEVVKFNGGYSDGMYVLDRNLGAASNASYDPTNIHYTEEDMEAIGGYFEVLDRANDLTDKANNTSRLAPKTITNNLGMHYTAGSFMVMSENELKNIGLQNDRNMGAGSVALSVDAGEVANNRIYIPAAGYYYGTTYRNDLHVNLWTRTWLGGTQGLTSTDDEYGLNYRVLDIVGGKVSYSGLRVSSGSGATIKENLLRYLPLRLVWRPAGRSGDASDVGDYVGGGDDTNMITIWVKNSINWGTINLHAWIDKDNYMSSWPGTAMQKTAHNGESNWYKIEIEKQWKSLIFNNGSSQTGNIENYRSGNENATVFEYEVYGSNQYRLISATGGDTPTPTTRSAITIMLRNEAGATSIANSGFRVYSSTGSQVGSNYVWGESNKVMYDGNQYLKVELTSGNVLLEALNNEGTIQFYGLGDGTTKFNQISANATDGAFFYTYKSSGVSYVTKATSASVATTPGWTGGGDTPSDQVTYRIYWKYDSSNFCGLNIYNNDGGYLGINTLYSNWPSEMSVGTNAKFKQYDNNTDYAYVEYTTTKLGGSDWIKVESRKSDNGYGGNDGTKQIYGNDFNVVDGIYSYTLTAPGQGNSGAPAAGGSSGSTITAPDGQIVVYCYNDANWPRIDMQYQYDNSNNGWPGTEMKLVPGSSNLYYAFAPKGCTQIGFSNNTSDFKYSKGTFNTDTYFSNSDGNSLSGPRNAPRRNTARR